MSDRFIKFIPSEEAFWLMHHKPNAFRLLAHIANTARRYNGHPDGLLIGQCHLQHWKFYNLSEQEYRTAKKILVERKHIIIIETNRTRKKSTSGTTTASTLVHLCSSTIWAINPEEINDRINDRATTDQRQTRKKKKEEEDHHPYPSSLPIADDEDEDDDDLSFQKDEEKQEIVKGVFLTAKEIEACVKIKGSLDSVKAAIEFILASPRRKYPIEDWPNALSRWKVENKTKMRVEDNQDFADRLCQEFQEFRHGHGWRCYMYTDRKKDERGILFEPESAYKTAVFISLVDVEFIKKCNNTLKINNIRKK